MQCDECPQCVTDLEKKIDELEKQVKEAYEAGQQMCECPQAASEAVVPLNDLLSCKRWHEAEVVDYKRYLADEEGDDTPLAKSMRKNFRLKITQHETYIKALAAVTT